MGHYHDGPDPRMVDAANEAVELRAMARRLAYSCEMWTNGVADFVEPLGFDREAACGPADLLPGLPMMRDLIVAFVRQADARAQGTGDFEAYHAARHDLVMAIGGHL